MVRHQPGDKRHQHTDIDWVRGLVQVRLFREHEFFREFFPLFALRFGHVPDGLFPEHFYLHHKNRRYPIIIDVYPIITNDYPVITNDYPVIINNKFFGIKQILLYYILTIIKNM